MDLIFFFLRDLDTKPAVLIIDPNRNVYFKLSRICYERTLFILFNLTMSVRSACHLSYQSIRSDLDETKACGHKPS